MMTKADTGAHITDGLRYLPAFVDKVASSAERDCRSCGDAASVHSNATVDLAKSHKLHVADAEADGRIVVKRWDAIGEEGVFVGSMPIAVGEILCVLEGVTVRRRRLTRSERRRLIGIRVDGRATHIDVEGRWPGKINHAPPALCNADWDADTHLVIATRDLQPGEQVFFDYGVGYWVDVLMNRDYERLSKDQRQFFDVMHEVVINYFWLSHTIHQRKLSQAMRVGIIASYLSRQCLGSYDVDSSPMFNEASSQAKVAVHDTHLIVRYLLGCGMDLQRGGAVNVQPSEPVNDQPGEPVSQRASVNGASKHTSADNMSSPPHPTHASLSPSTSTRGTEVTVPFS